MADSHLEHLKEEVEDAKKIEERTSEEWNEARLGLIEAVELLRKHTEEMEG